MPSLAGFKWTNHKAFTQTINWQSINKHQRPAACSIVKHRPKHFIKHPYHTTFHCKCMWQLRNIDIGHTGMSKVTENKSGQSLR